MVADETRISIEANPYYAWNVKGKTPIKKKKLEIHKAKTIFGALSTRTGKIIQYTSRNKKALGAIHLLNRVKQFKEKHYGQTSYQKVLLIWDNVCCHKSKEVKQWLRENPGIIELDNFPPYSPEMNPIEHVWKVLKKEINSLRGEATLTEIMHKARKFLKSNTFDYKLLGLDKHHIFKL